MAEMTGNIGMMAGMIGAALIEQEMSFLGMLVHATKKLGIAMKVGLANLGGKTPVELSAEEHHHQVGKGEVTDQLMTAHLSGGMTAAFRSGQAGHHTDEQTAAVTTVLATVMANSGKIGTGDSLGTRDGPKEGHIRLVEAVASSEQSADIEKMTLPWLSWRRGGEPTRICHRSMALAMVIHDPDMRLCVMIVPIGQ